MELYTLPPCPMVQFLLNDLFFIYFLVQMGFLHVESLSGGMTTNIH